MTAWAIETLFASALLMALVLAARGPVRRAFGPAAAYALWALPALRLLLPPLPAGWMRETATPLAAPLAAAGEQLAMLVLPTPAPDAAPPLLAGALVVLWCVGVAVFLVWQLLGYVCFTRRVAATGTTLGRVGGIALIVSDAVQDPLAYGLFARVVAVPRDFNARYAPAERELALAHEVAHHRRGDVAVNWAALLVLALHWFNPLAWAAFRAFRVDQEMAADAHVLEQRDPAERHAYACAIVKATRGDAHAAACGLHSVHDLKGRLRMLANSFSRGRRAAGAAIVAGATVALLGLTASGGDAAETVRAEVERATGVPLHTIAPAALLQAAPPTPPAPGRSARDKHVHVVKGDGVSRVTVTEGGQTRSLQGAEADAYLAEHPLPAPPAPPAQPTPGRPALAPLPPIAHDHAAAHPATRAAEALRNMPTIVSGPCRREPGGSLSAESMTVTRTEGGKRMTVICTNRIEAAARRAQLAAADARGVHRDAMAGALEGLRLTRENMASGSGFEHLTPEQRAGAIAGIEAAIKEMERETAERN